MFCGLILYDKDGSLLQALVHILNVLHALILCSYKIDKGKQF